MCGSKLLIVYDHVIYVRSLTLVYYHSLPSKSYIHTYIHIYTHTYIYIYMYVYIYVCMYVYICMYVCMYVYVCMYIYNSYFPVTL